MKSSSALASAAAMAQQAQTNLRSIQQQQQQYSDSLASSSSSTTTQVPTIPQLQYRLSAPNNTAASDHPVFFFVPHVLASRVVHVVASSQHGGESRMKSLARRNIAYRNRVLMYRAGSGEHGSALLQVRVVLAAMPRRLSDVALQGPPRPSPRRQVQR